MLYNFLLGLETILSIIIVILILLHRGRGSEAGAVFTGSASASVFGAKGSTPFLTKLIAMLAFVFLLNSLSLAYIANRDFGSGSVILQDTIMEDEQPLDDIPLDDAADIPQDSAADIPINDAADIPLDDAADIPLDGAADIPTDDALRDEMDDLPDDLIEAKAADDLAEVPRLEGADNLQEDNAPEAGSGGEEPAAIPPAEPQTNEKP